MACLLLTVAEVFTAISQSTAVCRDSVANNYVAGAPRTPHKHRALLAQNNALKAETQPCLSLAGWLPGCGGGDNSESGDGCTAVHRDGPPSPPCIQHSKLSTTP